MNARERFEQTRQAVKRLGEVQLQIMCECDDWRPPTVGKPGKADPTAARAIRAVDELGEKLAALRAEQAELEEFIGTSLAVIQGVRKGFGEIYANLLEWRYIDQLTWQRIHDEYGIPKSTGHYLLDISFDWIDSVGVSRLLKGEIDL